MRLELLPFLVCPQCRQPLNLHPFLNNPSAESEIEEGLLVCTECASPYPVTDGIPRLLPNAFRRQTKFRKNFQRELSQINFRQAAGEDQRRFEELHRLTARAFGYEWNTYTVTSRNEDVITWFWLTGADPKLYQKLSLNDVFTFYPTDDDVQKIDGSRLAGRTVLDVGCGMGKYLAVVSDYAETVIGLDLSDALTRARSVVKDRPNVHLVQGNILAPPLKVALVDFVYSVGVLHHTPDTHSAFLNSASLVKPGGDLAVWLYPRELEPNAYSEWIHDIQDRRMRPITCRMPPRMLRMVCAALGRLTFVRDRAAAHYQRTQSPIAYRIAKYAGAVAVGQHKDPKIAAFLNFDWYSPQYRSYHTEAELKRWYSEAGFENVRLLPQRVSAIGTNPPDLKLSRELIARTYLTGHGIEIGALHNPLKAPEGTIVKYVDRLSVPELRKQYPELDSEELVDVDIIADGERLETIADETQDFVIANHFVEHCQNPVGALLNMLRVLKPTAVLYLALPDKRCCFDSDRPVTPLEHVMRDYSEGPEWSRREHFDEWARLVSKTPDEDVESRVAELMHLDYSIHYHVWTPFEMLELLLSLRKMVPFEIELFLENAGVEMIFILRKPHVPTP